MPTPYPLNDRGVWDPTKIYLGEYTDDAGTVPRPEGGDFVWYQGARWVANYYHTGVNPITDQPGASGFWRLYTDPNTGVADTPNYNPIIPNAVTGLQTGFVSDDTVTLFWNPARVDGIGDVTHYDIYMDGAKVGTSTTTSFAVTGLEASDSSTFTVRAINASGMSAAANLTASTDAGQVENGKFYSPFVDMTLPTTNIVELARDSDLRDLTLAFMQTDNSDLDSNGNLIAGRVPGLAWGGITNTTLPTGVIVDQVKQLQALGGTITISFGGYNGRDPAVICAQYADHLVAGGMSRSAADAAAVDHLKTLYQSVMDTYGVTHLDFDIENAVYKNDEGKKYPVVDDADANRLRNLALIELKADNPDLHIAFTVATLPSGVSTTPSTLNNGWVVSGGGDVHAMLAQAAQDDVPVDVVNIMAMDYFDGPTANPDMGDAAIAAARAMRSTLLSLGLDAKVGVTPMLGQNDAYTPATGNEVFTLDDARDLAEFFQSTDWIAGFGAWQLPRDRANAVDTTGGANPNGTGSKPVSTSTGVVQSDFEFSRILEQIAVWTPTGGRGDDTIVGGDAFETLSGVDGSDVLRGMGYDDTLNGGSGSDILDGGWGNDTLNGGLGFDTADYRTATGAVRVNLGLTGPQNTGGSGEDRLSSVENLFGSDGYGDTLTGGVGGNRINGYGGNDTIRGGGGHDVLLGWFGNDLLDGGAGNDTLNGGSGVDTATYYYAGAGVTVSLALTGRQNTGGAGLDTLLGIENLNGSNFADTLTGGAGNNVINGYGGNDRITGGDGADVLTGGAGADTFVFLALTDSDGLGRDRITDYGAGDKLDLSAIDANGAGAGATAFVRIGNTDAFTAAGQLRLSQHGADTWLELNTDGDSAAEMTVLLTGNHTGATVEDGWVL